MIIRNETEGVATLEAKSVVNGHHKAPRPHAGLLWSPEQLSDAGAVGQLPAWWSAAYRGFRDGIEEQDYPSVECGSARLRFTFAESAEAVEDLESIRQATLEFVKGLRGVDREEADATVLVVLVRPAEPVKKFDDYEREMWGILQYLHDHDAEPTPENTPFGTHEPQWGLCFAGRALLIKTRTPAHKPRRGRSSGPALAVMIQERDPGVLMEAERSANDHLWKTYFPAPKGVKRRGRCPIRLRPEPAPAAPAAVNGEAAKIAGHADELVNPTTLPLPAFLMCPPLSISSEVPNNIWMQEYSEQDRIINRPKALQQYLALSQFLASDAVVYQLPAPANCGLQDITFTANVAFVPEHLDDKNVVLIANFSSEPRRGESKVATNFFDALGYRTVQVPFRFEGEAELKHLHDNVYVGGYGARSDRQAYRWMEEQFGMKVIAVEEVDPYLYHLDCSVFPVDRENTMVCTGLLTEAEIAAVEKETNIIDVTVDECYNGICNSVRLHNMLLCASDIHDHKAGTEDYTREIKKVRKLEDIAAAHCCEPVFFNLSEYFKSGALLSCMVMHLNRYSYGIKLF